MQPRLEKLGLPLDRILVSPTVPLEEFMERGALADVALDTAPISGGTTIVNGPADNGNGAIDHNGTMTISGGVLLALGSSGMVENPSSASPQCALGAYLTGGSAGSTVTFTNGSVSYSITAARAFSYALLSCGEMTDGSEWTVSIDGSAAVSGSVSGGITSLSQSGASAGMGGGMGSMPSNGGSGGMTPPGTRT